MGSRELSVATSVVHMHVLIYPRNIGPIYNRSKDSTHKYVVALDKKKSIMKRTMEGYITREEHMHRRHTDQKIHLRIKLALSQSSASHPYMPFNSKRNCIDLKPEHKKENSIKTT